MTRHVLPCSQLLYDRNIIHVPLCGRCALEDEDQEHLLCACESSHNAWRALADIAGPQMCFSSVHGIIQFLERPTRRRDDPKRFAKSVVAYVCWEIWKGRNRQLFENTVFIPQQVVGLALLQAKEKWESSGRVLAASLANWGTPRWLVPPTFTTFLQWLPPTPGQLKINFDGSVHRNHYRAGGGYLIRDSNARVLYAKGYPINSNSVPIVELCAMRDAIRHAVEVCCARFLWVQGDSLTVIQWANGAEPAGGLASIILDEVRFWVHRTRQCIFTHDYREVNSPADYLANAGSEGRSIEVSEDTLDATLRFLVRTDRSACIFTRRA